MSRPVKRNKKEVDYSQFGDADDDDEDFASITVPSNKKSKRVHSESKKEKKRTPKEETPLQKRSPNKRITLDDKLYQRHLEVALAVSVNELSADKRKDSKGPDDGETCKHIATESGDSSVLSSCKEASAEESETDSSFSEDDDDEFVIKKKIKENRKEGRKLNVNTERRAHKQSNLKSNSVGQEKSQPVLQTALSSSASAGKPLKTSSPVAAKKPSWTPPAAPGSSANKLERVPVASPTQGLRLGLSRLARVKPLHPSFASS